MALTLNACSTIPTSPRADEVRGRVLPMVNATIHERGFATNSELFLRAFKEDRVIEAWMLDPASGAYKLYETFPVCAMSGDVGPKTKEGDKQAPEGFYAIQPKNLNPRSQYHLAFNLGYPNAYDQANGRTGNFLMVHGDCVSIGCYAIGDGPIEHLYMLTENAFRHGQSEIPVHLFPFRMTPENMARHTDSEWQDFWYNLKAGYDIFEATRQVPAVSVIDGQYDFEAPEPSYQQKLASMMVF